MRRRPLLLLHARLLSIYLLSLSAVLGSILAWRPDRAALALVWVWPPAVLAAAALAGAALHDRLLGMVDRVLLGRLRSLLNVVYGAFLSIVGAVLLSGSREGGDQAVALLQGVQAIVLLLAGWDRGYLWTIVNAFALTSASMLPGGAGASMAASLHLGILLFFMTTDHLARQLTDYPVDTLPDPGPLVLRNAMLSLVIAAALAAWFWSVPPAAYQSLRKAAGGGTTVTPDQIHGLIQNLFLTGVVSALLFIAILRWGGWSRSETSEASEVAIAQVRPLPFRADRTEPVPARTAPEGWRVRIVDLYLRTTEQLARWGIRRPGSQTPVEFSRSLSPASAAGELTRLFYKARFGNEAITESEVQDAARASRDLLDQKRGRRS